MGTGIKNTEAKNGVSREILSEGDGTRTRNHRIDSRGIHNRRSPHLNAPKVNDLRQSDGLRTPLQGLHILQGL